MLRLCIDSALSPLDIFSADYHHKHWHHCSWPNRGHSYISPSAPLPAYTYKEEDISSTDCFYPPFFFLAITTPMLLLNQCWSMGDTLRMEGWLADCVIQEKSHRVRVLIYALTCDHGRWLYQNPLWASGINVKGCKQVQSRCAVTFLFSQKKSW